MKSFDRFVKTMNEQATVDKHNTITVVYGLTPQKDNDTLVLQNLWKGLPNVHVYYTYRDDPREIRVAAENESNILIMCGHGSPGGLFGRRADKFGATGFGYTIDGSVNFRAKYVIGMWCHAKDYAKQFHKTGFFTSMYISNLGEAKYELGRERIAGVTNEMIWKSETDFCKLINGYIQTSLDKIEQWPEMVLRDMPPRNIVEKFNHEAVEYIYGDQDYDRPEELSISQVLEDFIYLNNDTDDLQVLRARFKKQHPDLAARQSIVKELFGDKNSAIDV